MTLLATSRAVGASEARVKALFFVTGDVDPGLLPRVLEPVAKMGLVPARVHASSENGDGSEQSIDLRLGDIAQREAMCVEKAIRRVPGVAQVLVAIEAVS